ncbi:MAG: glycosyltransferase [Aureliella sp.]
MVAVSINDSRRLEAHRVEHQLIIHGVSRHPPLLTKDYDFLCVGRNVPHKNLFMFEELVESFKMGDSRIRGCLITDNYSTRSQSISVLRNLSDDEMVDIYRRSRFILSFSEYEGFGLAVVEAISCGCIPICFGNTSFKEILKDVPETIVDELTVEKFESRCMHLMKVDTSDLLIRLDQISQRYGLDAMVTALEKFINS